MLENRLIWPSHFSVSKITSDHLTVQNSKILCLQRYKTEKTADPHVLEDVTMKCFFFLLQLMIFTLNKIFVVNLETLCPTMSAHKAQSYLSSSLFMKFYRCMQLTAGCVLCALPSLSRSRTTSSLHSHRQPWCRWRASHQLPRMPVAYQPGWKAASARGQMHSLQWSDSKWRPLLRQVTGLQMTTDADIANITNIKL